MNPAINKQEKKNSQHFLGNQTENFPKKPNTIFWAFKISQEIKIFYSNKH